MSNDIPAVSVIIPVYNAAELLKDGLSIKLNPSFICKIIITRAIH